MQCLSLLDYSNKLSNFCNNCNLQLVVEQQELFIYHVEIITNCFKLYKQYYYQLLFMETNIAVNYNNIYLCIYVVNENAFCS